MDYVLIEGVRDCTVCRRSVPDGSKKESGRFDHKDLRAVLLTSSSTAEEPLSGFQRMADNSFLTVTKSHGIEFSPFGRF